ncbi:MAG: hypothetical protein JXR67_02430 [Bacteroidales bacterium]|nr:hypothetical protein [Bacteroidales bacterium]
MKYSYILSVIMVLSITASAFSQDFEIGGNSLRIETGYAFTGSGDLDGFCYYNEFIQPLNSWFSVAPSIGFYSFFGDDEDIELLKDVKSAGLDLTGYFYPVRTDIFDLEAGLGFYVRRWHWVVATGPDVEYSSSELHLSGSSHGDYFVAAPGYTVSLGAIMKTSPRTGISLKGVYQNDTRGIVVATVRAGLNIWF